MQNITKYTVSVRDWSEEDGRIAYVVCFFNRRTVKPKYCRVIECGEKPTDMQHRLIAFLLSENTSFICKFSDLPSAVAFFEPFAAGQRRPSKVAQDAR